MNETTASVKDFFICDKESLKESTFEEIEILSKGNKTDEAIEELKLLLNKDYQVIIWDKDARWPYTVEEVARVPKSYLNQVDGLTVLRTSGRTVSALSGGLYRVEQEDDDLVTSELPSLVSYIKRVIPEPSKTLKEAYEAIMERIKKHIRRYDYENGERTNIKMADHIEEEIRRFEEQDPGVAQTLFFDDTFEREYDEYGIGHMYVMSLPASNGKTLIIRLAFKHVAERAEDPICMHIDYNDGYPDPSCPHFEEHDLAWENMDKSITKSIIMADWRKSLGIMPGQVLKWNYDATLSICTHCSEPKNRCPVIDEYDEIKFHSMAWNER